MGKYALFEAGAGVTPAEGDFATIGSRGTTATVSTEAYAQFKLKFAGILSKLWAANAAASTTVVTTMRLNTAGTAMTVTNTTNDVQEDAVHTQAVAVNDLINVKFTGIVGSPQPRTRVIFEASATHTAIYAADDALTAGVSATTYHNLANGASTNGTEANIKQKVRTAGTFSNAQAYVSVNGAATDSTLRTRKNAGNGAIVLTLTAGVAGFYSDFVNTDAVVDGDDYCWQLVTGSGSAITLNMRGLHFQNASDRQHDIFSGSATGYARAASGTAEFYTASGRFQGSATESTRKLRFGFPSIVSKLRIFVSANTYSADGTMVSRVNGANGAATFAITAGVAGFYEDTTHSDTLAADDDYCAQITGGTSGSITIRWMGVTQRDTTPAVLTAATGFFTLTGQTAGLLSARRILAATGSFTLTGQAAGLLTARRLVAAQGSFTLTGQTAALLRSYTLRAEYGSFALSGQAIRMLGWGRLTLTDESWSVVSSTDETWTPVPLNSETWS